MLLLVLLLLLLLVLLLMVLRLALLLALVLLLLLRQLCKVQTARVAQRPRAIRSPAPLWRLPNIT